jgi:hypothetical protein
MVALKGWVVASHRKRRSLRSEQGKRGAMASKRKKAMKRATAATAEPSADNSQQNPVTSPLVTNPHKATNPYWTPQPGQRTMPRARLLILMRQLWEQCRRSDSHLTVRLNGKTFVVPSRR